MQVNKKKKKIFTILGILYDLLVSFPIRFGSPVAFNSLGIQRSVPPALGCPTAIFAPKTFV